MKQINRVKQIVAIMLMVVILATSVSGTVKAADVNLSDIHVSEEEYASVMSSVVEPYLDSYRQSGYFTGADDLSIYYEKFLVDNPKGTVIVSHGFTENLVKMGEMIYYFMKMGYSVYGLEHRGHARSGRLGVDSSQVNVDKFQYYVDDMKTFLDEIVIPEATDENLYVYGHSLGGGIAVRFLEEYPDYFDGAILNAPMIEVNTGSVPAWIAKIIAYGASITPFKNDYIAGQGTYDGSYDFEGSGTSSQARYDYYFDIQSNTELFQMNGGSYHWLKECFWATHLMRKESEASKVTIPVLLFQAGQDAYVGNDGEDTFASYAKNCTVVRYENGKHEMFRECDNIQIPYLIETFDFLSRL